MRETVGEALTYTLRRLLTRSVVRKSFRDVQVIRPSVPVGSQKRTSKRDRFYSVASKEMQSEG